MLREDYTARADEFLRKQLPKGVRSTQLSAQTWNKKTTMDSHNNLKNINDTFDGLGSVISGQATPSVFSQNNLTIEKGLASQGSLGAHPNQQSNLLLSKLQHDREMIKLQMQQNERIMETRIAQMKEIAEERNNVERKVNNACILIQKHVRGMI